MAKGYVRTESRNVKTLKYTNGSAVTAGDLVLINGHLCCALNDAGASVETVYAYEARKMLVPKEAALAINVGDAVYWVTANSNVNKTSAGNTKAGVCVEGALSADTTVLIELKPNA
jgi:predicted RecA/RadA family phage recombinase